ncbi:MAG: hypothetical protein ACYCXG_08780 [Acidiferrobacter sp.]
MSLVTKSRLSVVLRTRWRNKAPRTIDDLAGVVGFNVWKIAQETFRHMESEAFRFGSDAQVTRVMTELIAFLVHSIDRIVYTRMAPAERQAFMNALGTHLAKTMENNQTDLFGPGAYRSAFVDLLNTRFRDYAVYQFGSDGPSYSCLRDLGERISEAMAVTDNRWVVEYIMDIEAPDMLKFLNKLLSDVLVPMPVSPDGQ